jgi:hypothetical protein
METSIVSTTQKKLDISIERHENVWSAATGKKAKNV